MYIFAASAIWEIDEDAYLCLSNIYFYEGGGGLNATFQENGHDRPVDLLYLKNVLLKFVLSASTGNTEQVSHRISIW